MATIFKRSPNRMRRQIRRRLAQTAVAHAQYRWFVENVGRFIGRAQVRRLRAALGSEFDLVVFYEVRRRAVRQFRMRYDIVGQAADKGGA